MNRYFFHIVAVVFILGWWGIAHYFQNRPRIVELNYTRPTSSNSSSALQFLSELKREELVSALEGNFSTMTRLLISWDVDAEILEQSGYSGIQRLPKDKLLTSCRYANQLFNGSEAHIRAMRLEHEVPIVIDDTGAEFSAKLCQGSTLPQTYAAASIILALKGCEAISALPHGFRQYQNLFPNRNLKDIKLDCDKFHAEAIARNRPGIAFVADYSNPALLEVLKNQGIPTFMFCKMNSIATIMNAIERIGYLTDSSIEATILTTFMEGALLNIDNRLAVFKQERLPFPKLLFLYFYDRWLIPSDENLTGELLKRLQFEYQTMNEDAKSTAYRWMKPLTQEQMIRYDPSHLIIAVNIAQPSCLSELLQSSPLDKLTASINKNVRIIDAEVQQSNSQHVVLAYYDLFQAFISFGDP